MRLIIDTDPGNGVPGADIDDGLAIGLALRSPEVDLEAVTVVAGNVPVDRGVQCARELLTIAGHPEIPVHRGASHPLVQDPAQWRARLDARRDEPRAQELWSGLHLPDTVREPHPTPAARALVERVDAAPGEITLLAIGPLTNVAAAMLLDDTFADKLGRLVVMGGAFEARDVLQELNSSYDTEATRIVLRSRAPTLVVPLDVTLQTFMNLADVDVLGSGTGALGDYLARTVRPWVTWLAERFGRDGCALHDPLALAALIDPSLITTRRAVVDIELTGALTRGRTVSWDPAVGEFPHAGLTLPDSRPVEIADSVDNDRLIALLLRRLVER